MPERNMIHDPYITNNNGSSVAIWLAVNKIVPPKIWYHNPYM